MWDQVLEHFAAEQRSAGLATRTIEGREACLRMLAHRSGKSPLEVTKMDLLELLSRPHARTGGELAPGTKQVERSYLQTWGRWMVDEGYRTDDPAGRLRKVKVPRRRPRPLRLEHIDLMLDSGIRQSTIDIITIGALTGLRVGEIVKIRGEDIDMVSGTIRSTRKGQLQHIIHMTDVVVEIARRMPARGWWFPSPYTNRLFPDGGGHILMKSASTAISICLRKIGIHDPRITAHSLRHFYATTMLRQGVQVRVVQEAMGHASLATTQLYAEVTDEDLAAAAAAMSVIRPGQTSRLAG